MAYRFASAGFRVVVALAAAFAFALTVASAANAQSAGDQYGTPTAPSGPAAEEQATVQSSGGDDGVVGPGDVVVIEGDYAISDGASVTLQDSDGTQGTFVDGENATITEGSIVITVTDFPIINVPGANGVLNTEGLFVVATTGISAAGGDGAGGAADQGAAGGAAAGSGNAAASAGGSGGESQPASSVAGILPATGGPLFLGLLGGAAMVGAAALALRKRLSDNR